MTESDTVITVVGPGHDFEEGLERQILAYNPEDWERSYVWPTQWMKDGIHLVHDDFGKIGLRKTVTASVQYGFDRYWEEYEDELKILDGDRTELIRNAPAMITDSLSVESVDAKHMRDTVGSQEWDFFLPEGNKGLLREVASALGMNLSQLYRHCIAITLYEGREFLDWDDPSLAEYREFLFRRTEFRADQIQHGIQMAEKYQGDNE